jgi:hypothetical protein
MLLALPCLASLNACASNVSIETLAPPPERLTCAAQPAPPAGDTDREAAQFLIDVITAGQDCRDQLAWIRDWVQATGNPKER